MTIEAVVDLMQQAVDMRRDVISKMVGMGGMRVPYHGPLCSAHPDVLDKVERWIKRLRRSQGSLMTTKAIIDSMQYDVNTRHYMLQMAEVPYSGPLRSAAPSEIRDLQWWIRDLRDNLPCRE